MLCFPEPEMFFPMQNFTQPFSIGCFYTLKFLSPLFEYTIYDNIFEAHEYRLL